MVLTNCFREGLEIHLTDETFRTAARRATPVDLTHKMQQCVQIALDEMIHHFVREWRPLEERPLEEHPLVERPLEKRRSRA